MEHLVLDVASLFHAIDAFDEFHHSHFPAKCSEAVGLFHVYGFILRKDTVKESSLNVKLL